jgi:hypothetical protein
MHAAYPLPVTGGPLSALAEVRIHVTAATAMSDLASAAQHLACFDSIWRAADSGLECQAHLRG